MKIVTYTKEYNIDGALAAQGGSIEGILNAITALNAFIVFGKTMDSEMKDVVLQSIYDSNNPVIVGLKDLQKLLNGFLDVEAGRDIEKKEEDPSALINVKREVVIILASETKEIIDIVGRVFAGNRNSDNRPFIKLEADFGNYFWNDDLATFDESVIVTPDNLDSRWVKEGDFSW